MKHYGLLMKVVWLVLGLIVILSLAFTLFGVPSSGRDFYIYWSAARALQAGHSPYDLTFLQATQQAAGWDITREPIPFQPYLYPPWLAGLMWPLGWLPFRSALAIWLAVSGVAIFAALVIELRLFTGAKRGLLLFASLLMGLTYLPVLHMLVVAQATALLCLFVALMAWSLARGHDRLAGISVGFLAIKPQIGLIVAGVVAIGWLMHRRWRPVLWLMGTWLVCVLAAFVIDPNWISGMLTAPQKFQEATGSLALANPADGPTVFAALRVDTPGSIVLRTVVVAGLLLIAVLIIRRVRQRLEPSMLGLSALGCVAVFMLTPYARAYDLALVIWPVVDLIRASTLSWGVRYGTAFFVYMWPIVLIAANADGVWNVVAVLSLTIVLLWTESSAQSLEPVV